MGKWERVPIKKWNVTMTHGANQVFIERPKLSLSIPLENTLYNLAFIDIFRECSL